MKSLYTQWINRWENDLAFRSTNRVVRPFDWGLEWVREWPFARQLPQNGHNAREYLATLNQLALKQSDEFYSYQSPGDFSLSNSLLTNSRKTERGAPLALLRFTSPVRTPYPENNIVHAQWFPAKSKPGTAKKAVVVLPHWNAPANGHNGLARGIAKLGISALRLSLPYHDYRMPAELERADYAVSSNVGRTLDAARQAVIDTRCCFDWLEQQGYERLGIVGTSLGSCYACLASAHDARIRVNVFNHCSTYFADVVWTGLSSRHIRQGLEQSIDLEALREAWMAISPVSYLEKFAAQKQKSLFIYTTYDTTFLPEFSRDIVGRMATLGVDHKVVVLPCGHYTMGETPFKYITGYHICSYLKRML